MFWEELRKEVPPKGAAFICFMLGTCELRIIAGAGEPTAAAGLPEQA